MALLTSGRTRADRVRPGRRTGTGGSGRWRRLRRISLPYLLLLPALLFELLIHLVPMVYGVLMSFLKLTQFYLANWTAAPSAGLDNYRFALDVNGPAGAALLRSFGVTIAYTLLSVGFCWLLGTMTAVLMQGRFRGRTVLRTLFLVPYALPMYTAVITWSFLLQRDNGLVNHVLVDQLHLSSGRPFWLIGGNSFWSMLVVSIWRNWPFAFLIIAAGLQSIPTDLYESAVLDGAGIMSQIRRITLPLLRPVNQVLLLVLFLWTFNDFNTPYVLFGKSAPQQADVISIHIYQNSFVTWNFGTGSAMSVLLLLFLLIVTGVYLIVTGRRRRHA